METEGRVGVLVADSGAFIKGAPLQKWSSEVVTVREVITEIRDKATRERLQVLPYELSFREPSSEALRHGTALSPRPHSQSCECLVCFVSQSQVLQRGLVTTAASLPWT